MIMVFMFKRLIKTLSDPHLAEIVKIPDEMLGLYINVMYNIRVFTQNIIPQNSEKVFGFRAALKEDGTEGIYGELDGF
jgi:hypothetical protein